jgi:hypothetical protein
MINHKLLDKIKNHAYNLGKTNLIHAVDDIKEVYYASVNGRETSNEDRARFFLAEAEILEDLGDNIMRAFQSKQFYKRAKACRKMADEYLHSP